MELFFKARFHTDGDYCFDKTAIREKIKDSKSLYKNAKIQFSYQHDGDYIYVVLNAKGDASACRYCFRDLIEKMICSICTSRYRLVGNLYKLLTRFLEEDLWVKIPLHKSGDLSGNYDRTILTLHIFE